MEKDPEVARITNRHIGRLLTRLDEIGIPEIAKREIRREMWEQSTDLIEAVTGGRITIR
jgi:hypothetical protein